MDQSKTDALSSSSMFTMEDADFLKLQLSIISCSWITSQKFHLGSAVSAQQVAWVNQKQSCENKIYAFATLIALQYNFYIITIVTHAH